MKNILKILIAFIIIYFLINYNIINIVELKKVFNNFNYIFYILILMFITIPLGTFRWWMLLDSEKYNISYTNAYLLYSTGLFFNIFMPGGAGGDITKGYYLFKYVEKKQRTLAIFTILVDRAIGFHALLFVISSLGFMIADKIFYNQDLYKLFYIILIFMITSIPVIFVIINFSGSIVKFLENIKNNFAVIFLIKIFQSLQIYKNRKLVIFKCWTISIVNHICLLSCFYITSISLNIDVFSYFEAAFVAGASLITNVIPLTPGGFGIGESSFNYLSKFLYENENIAFGSIFFITFRVLFNIICLSGAISFIVISKPGNSYKKLNN